MSEILKTRQFVWTCFFQQNIYSIAHAFTFACNNCFVIPSSIDDQMKFFENYDHVWKWGHMALQFYFSCAKNSLQYSLRWLYLFFWFCQLWIIKWKFLENLAYNFLLGVLKTGCSILRDDCGSAVGAVSTITTLLSLLSRKTSAALFLFKIRGHASKQLWLWDYGWLSSKLFQVLHCFLSCRRSSNCLELLQLAKPLIKHKGLRPFTLGLLK